MSTPHNDLPHLRELSCCKSEPECPLCPLLPQNAHRSLKELAEAGLYANLKGRRAE
ncbi:MAG: hypothetical protein V4510_07090 [bacterium]